MSAPTTAAEVMWAAIDDKGIRGRLYREDCDYLADALREVFARVWDEGHSAGMCDVHPYGQPATVNPYRIERGEGA